MPRPSTKLVIALLAVILVMTLVVQGATQGARNGSANATGIQWHKAPPNRVESWSPDDGPEKVASSLHVPPRLSDRCAEPNTEHEQIVLKNARLFYRDWQGDEPVVSEGDPLVNRATGCLYATGKKTEFGFANVIEGESFGYASGAGDYVAFSTMLWEAADGSDDAVEVWNLRTQKRVHRDSCSEDTDYGDCSVLDVKVAASGTSAYIICDDDACRAYLKRPGAPRTLLGRVDESAENARLSVSNGRVYWPAEDGTKHYATFG